MGIEIHAQFIPKSERKVFSKEVSLSEFHFWEKGKPTGVRYRLGISLVMITALEGVFGASQEDPRDRRSHGVGLT